MPDYLLGLSGVTDEIRRLQLLLTPSQMTGIMQFVGGRIGVKAETVLDQYPVASGKPLAVFYDRTSQAQKPYRPGKGAPVRQPGASFKSKFKSLQQQRKVFILRKAGKIPYPRTGTLGRSITSTVKATPTSAETSIGTNLKYAPFVIDRDRQSHYHQGTWPTLQDGIEAMLPELEAIGVNSFVRKAIEVLNG